jgi:hypothetical protein
MSVFTDYLRTLGGGEPPSDRELARLARALRDAIRAELQRRGLWDRSPSYLGVVGWQRWEAPGEGARGAAGEDRPGALDELIADAYSYVFVDRLRSLEAQLRLKPDIEGLVVLNVRNFVHDRQRAHDPLGFRVFEIARAAVRRSLDAGDLHLLGGDPRIRNETVLGFSSRAALPSPPGRDLGALAARWNDELLPSLFGTHGKGEEDVAGRLRRRLPELRAEGVEAFLFRDLVEPLKHDARTRWAALLRQSGGAVWAERQGETGGAGPIALPYRQIDEGESFDRLNRRVAESLDRLETDERTRRYLTGLWDYLSRQASRLADFQEETSSGRPVEDRIGRLSQRQIARQLKIPRERLPGLLATLGRMVEQCRAAEPGRVGPHQED